MMPNDVLMCPVKFHHDTKETKETTSYIRHQTSQKTGITVRDRKKDYVALSAISAITIQQLRFDLRLEKRWDILAMQ